jgi:hypothetical protein
MQWQRRVAYYRTLSILHAKDEEQSLDIALLSPVDSLWH